MDYNIDAMKKIEKRGFYYSLRYLAGLIDADGNIYIDFRKTKKSMYPIIRITIAQKYPNLLFSLYNQLNIGSLNCNKDNCWIWDITGNQARTLLYELAPYLIIKKEQAFYCLGEINSKYKIYSKKIITNVKRENTNLRHVFDNDCLSIILQDYEWLAGFFDGDGSVTCHIPKNCNKPKITLEITIDKKDRIFTKKIVQLYNGTFTKRKNGSDSFMYNVQSDKLNLIKKLLKYSNLKYIQLYETYNWFSKYKKHEKNIVSKKESIELKNRLSEYKKEECLYPFGLNDVDTYQRWTRTTAIYPKETGVYYTALGFSGEVGELCNIIKKIIRDDKNKISKDKLEKLKSELCDCWWYGARLADELGFKISDLLNKNVSKLESRKKRGTLEGSGDER